MNLLTLVIISSLTVSLATALAYPALKNAVSGALGILLLLTVASPFVTVVRGALDGEITLPDFSVDGEEKFEQITTAAFERGVAEALVDRFGGVLSGVRVRARGFDPTDMRADGLTVVLPSAAATVDYRAVKDYLVENFTRGGGCEVYYE